MSIAEARWSTRIEDTGAWAPVWLGLCIVIGYLLIRFAFDGIYLVIWGFPTGVYPLWQGVWWPEIVNAILVGYVPAALMIARRGIDRDIFTNKHIDATSESPRLANLIAYYQLINGTREWPINAAKLLRFLMYLLIGLGSWLGSAFVELMLDRTLSG